MMACAIGCRPLAPRPWSTRATSKMGRVGVRPQRQLAAVKMVMHSRKKFRWPMTLDAQVPPADMIAFETRQLVRTEVPDRCWCLYHRTMWESDIGNGGIENLHEGSEGNSRCN